MKILNIFLASASFVFCVQALADISDSDPVSDLQKGTSLVFSQRFEIKSGDGKSIGSLANGLKVYELPIGQSSSGTSCFVDFIGVAKDRIFMMGAMLVSNDVFVTSRGIEFGFLTDLTDPQFERVRCTSKKSLTVGELKSALSGTFSLQLNSQIYN